MKTNVKQLGIPYMGGKRVLAEHFVEVIANENPNMKYFYDLFGGGGAISLEMLQRSQIERVFYNDINLSVVNLFKKVIDKEFDFNNFFKCIDRDTFFRDKDGIDWYAGLIKTCWSFGYNQKNYAYGKSIEQQNLDLCHIIMNEDRELFKEYFPGEIFDNCFRKNNPFDTRVKLVGLYNAKSDKKQKIMLQTINNVKRLYKIRNSGLEFSKLELFSKSYEEVNINTPIDETVIYMDPPYKDKGKYEYDIDHTLLEQYIKNSPYKIYISSYEFDLPVVKEWDRVCTISSRGRGNKNKVKERLFCNQKGIK